METVRGPHDQAALPGAVATTALDLLGGLCDSVQGRYDVLGVLGTNPAGEHVYLARDVQTGELVALKLTATAAPGITGAGGGYALTAQRVVDDTIPPLQGNCQACNAPLVGWQRYCVACGSDVTGFPPDDRPDTSRAALLAAVKAAAQRDYEVLGALDRAHGGGPVYFARSLTSGQLVALRLHGKPDPQQGHPRFELAATHIVARRPTAAIVEPPAPPITPWPAVPSPSSSKVSPAATAVNDIFISYSHGDKPAADAVCAGLEAAGLSCWIAPRDILPGRNWGASIVEAIAQSRILVLVFSSRTNASQQVLREVERAVHHDLPVVPFRIEDVLFSHDLEYYFSAVHWLDAFPPPLEPHLRQLTRVVRTLLGPQTGRPPRRSNEQTAPRPEQPIVSSGPRPAPIDVPIADRPITPAPFIFVPKPLPNEGATGERPREEQRERTPVAQPAAARPAKYCPICGSDYAADLSFCPKDAAALMFRAVGGDLIGQVVADRYRVVSKIGEGGMGTVYLAEHVQIGRLCALKVVKPELAADRDAMKRFANEAKLSSKVNHPNVAIIYDYGEDTSGTVYLSMEYVDGKPLSAILRPEGGSGAPLPILRAVGIAEQVANALAAAHKLGVIHRDLKPDNILVSAGDGDIVKVVDFGIAKAAQDGPHTLTRLGFVVGTPRYMSPEQMTGDPVDGRTDVFSLGCVLYEMLTGEYSVDAPSIQAVLTTRLTTPPPSPRERNPKVPRELDDVVLKALARLPAERYDTIADFRDALRAALAPKEIASTPPARVDSASAAAVAAGSVASPEARAHPHPIEVVPNDVPSIGAVRPTSKTLDRTTSSRRLPAMTVGAVLGVAAIAALGYALPWSVWFGNKKSDPIPVVQRSTGDIAAGAVSRDSIVRARPPAQTPIAGVDSTVRAKASARPGDRVVPVARIMIVPAQATVDVGGRIQLAATPQDAAGNALANRPLRWRSRNAAVADVDAATGEVRGVSAGTAEIEATSGGISAAATITAQVPRRVIDHLTVIAPAALLTVGESKPILVTVTDTRGNVVSDCDVSWSSDDPTVASVNASTGALRGSAAGTTRITASCEGKSASVGVTVRAAEPPPVDRALASRQIAAEVEAYVSSLGAHDAARIAALSAGATGTEAENAGRLLDLVRRSEAKLGVSAYSADAPKITGDRAVSTFSAQLAWRSAFGAGRGERVYFRAELERAATGWRMTSCVPTGKPGLK